MRRRRSSLLAVAMFNASGLLPDATPWIGQSDSPYVQTQTQRPGHTPMSLRAARAGSTYGLPRKHGRYGFMHGARAASLGPSAGSSSIPNASPNERERPNRRGSGLREPRVRARWGSLPLFRQAAEDLGLRDATPSSPPTVQGPQSISTMLPTGIATNPMAPTPQAMAPGVVGAASTALPVPLMSLPPAAASPAAMYDWLQSLVSPPFTQPPALPLRPLPLGPLPLGPGTYPSLSDLREAAALEYWLAQVKDAASAEQLRYPDAGPARDAGQGASAGQRVRWQRPLQFYGNEDRASDRALDRVSDDPNLDVGDDDDGDDDAIEEGSLTRRERDLMREQVRDIPSFMNLEGAAPYMTGNSGGAKKKETLSQSQLDRRRDVAADFARAAFSTMPPLVSAGAPPFFSWLASPESILKRFTSGVAAGASTFFAPVVQPNAVPMAPAAAAAPAPEASTPSQIVIHIHGEKASIDLKSS